MFCKEARESLLFLHFKSNHEDPGADLCSLDRSLSRISVGSVVQI